MNTTDDKQWLEALRVELSNSQALLPDSVGLELTRIRHRVLRENSNAHVSPYKLQNRLIGWLDKLMPSWQPYLAGATLLMLGSVLMFAANPVEDLEPVWSEHAELLGDDLSLYLWLTDEQVDSDLLGG